MGSVEASSNETSSGSTATESVGTETNSAQAPEGRKPTTREPSCGPEPSAAARSTVPARSQPGRRPASLASALRTSPLLSEIAATLTSVYEGIGYDSSTSATENLPTASGSTITVRISAIRTPPDLGHTERTVYYAP